MRQNEGAAAERFSAIVERLHPLSPRVVAVRLRVRSPAPFVWIPGQHVLLATEDARDVEIPYSIASAATPAAKGAFDLAISGEGSRELLAKLAPGVEVHVSSPRGAFLWRAPEFAAVLIAIGTGLAPLRAMVEAGVASGARAELVLLYGARTEADILWREEFQALARECSGFRFEPTLSKPEASWSGRKGRVQDHLDELVRPLRGVDAYLCGSKLMVDDCVLRLTRELGVDPTHVFSEAF